MLLYLVSGMLILTGMGTNLIALPFGVDDIVVVFSRTPMHSLADGVVMGNHQSVPHLQATSYHDEGLLTIAGIKFHHHL